MESLDNILSGGGEAVSAPEPENVVTEATQEQQPQETVAEAEGERQEGQATVPHQALHAEKQKVKRYTEEVANVREELAALRAQNQQLAQLMAQSRQQPQQQEEPPDWYTDPARATEQFVSPYVQRIEHMIRQQGQQIAQYQFGADKVKAAEDAFMQAVSLGRLDAADEQRIRMSPNPYAEVVQWHQRKQVLEEMGDDPAAYREKLKQELLAELQAQQQSAPAQQSAAPVMPSNLAAARNVGSRSGPAWSGPASLGDIFKR